MVRQKISKLYAHSPRRAARKIRYARAMIRNPNDPIRNPVSCWSGRAVRAFDCEDASKMDAWRSICERHSAVSTRYANRSLVRNAALARPGVTRYGRRNTITSSSTGVARSGAHVQQRARPARSRMKRRNIVFRQAFLPPPASFASSRAR